MQRAVQGVIKSSGMESKTCVTMQLWSLPCPQPSPYSYLPVALSKIRLHRVFVTPAGDERGGVFDSLLVFR